VFLLFFYVIVSSEREVSKTFVWRDLTSQELDDWYSPIDLCMLQSTARNSFPAAVRKNCSHMGMGGHRGCSVGMGSNNFPCYPPFVSRKSFRRGLVGYTNASLTPLIDAFQRFARTNTSVVFIGDSTMRQKLQALECELYREDGGVKLRGSMAGILPCHTPLVVTLRDGSTVDLHGISMGPNSVNCLKGGLGKRDPHGGVFENARDIIRKLNDQGRKVFVLANVGLWYNDDELFDRIIPGILDWLVTVAEETKVKNIVTWHETMSQHWPNTIGSGYFYKPYAEAKETGWGDGSVDIEGMPIEDFQVPTCCTSITNTSSGTDWRNEMVRKHLSEKSRGDKIYIVPFVEATRETPDMHVCHPRYKYDCTHYCYWPLLWQILWSEIDRLSLSLS